MKAIALKVVRYDRIEDHLRQGWMTMIPNAPHRHLVYGIEMKWICECPVPGGFGRCHLAKHNDHYAKEFNRVPETKSQERTHERSRIGT